MLKLTKLFFALSLLVFATSCSSDDEAPEADLVGTWTALSFNADISTMTTANGTDISVTTTALGSNFDYDLTFTESAFTTTGGYDMTTSGNVDGMVISETTSSYTGVSGSGTYTSDNTTLTINGSFFSFDFNGTPLMATGQAQTVNYTFNANDQLVITQNETTETTTQGVTVTSTITSSSTWEKQ